MKYDGRRSSCYPPNTMTPTLTLQHGPSLRFFMQPDLFSQLLSTRSLAPVQQYGLLGLWV
jgi:hypothetical protein